MNGLKDKRLKNVTNNPLNLDELEGKKETPEEKKEAPEEKKTDNEKVAMYVKVSKEDRKRLKKYCAENDTNITDVIAAALAAYLDK